jgi:uncharacterized membrane protein YraQ (UPF0718 family)
MPEAQGVFLFSIPDFFLSFFSILAEGAPFLLLGAVFSALVDGFLPAPLLQRLLPRAPVPGILAAMGAGFLFPLCECGALPVVRRLIRKGVPVPAATTYLLASALLNPLVLLSTWLAFRGQDPWLMAGLRLGGGALLIFCLGLWIVRTPVGLVLRPEVLIRAGEPEEEADFEIDPQGPFPAAQRFVQTVIRDFLNVLPFLVLGAACAAVANTAFPRPVLETVLGHPMAAPAVGIAFAQLLSLCSTTDAFVIAAFSVFPAAAKLAFLVAGPLFDLKLYWLYRAMYQHRFVHRLWVGVTCGTLILAWLYQGWSA